MSNKFVTIDYSLNRFSKRGFFSGIECLDVTPIAPVGNIECMTGHRRAFQFQGDPAHQLAYWECAPPLRRRLVNDAGEHIPPLETLKFFRQPLCFADCRREANKAKNPQRAKMKELAPRQIERVFRFHNQFCGNKYFILSSQL